MWGIYFLSSKDFYTISEGGEDRVCVWASLAEAQAACDHMNKQSVFVSKPRLAPIAANWIKMPSWRI